MSESEITEPIKMDFTTHEPTFLQKLAQAYWLHSKSWLLKRFKVDGDIVYIETLNGKSISAPIKQCEFKCWKNNAEQQEITIKTGNEKIHFKEIPFMLSDDEWEVIVDFCLNADKHKTSTIEKIAYGMRKIKETIE